MIRLQRARGAASKPQLGSPVWHVATAQAERVPEARLQAGGQDGLARRGSDTESCEVTLWKLSGNNWSWRKRMKTIRRDASLGARRKAKATGEAWPRQVAANPRLPRRVTRLHQAENLDPWLKASIESTQKRAREPAFSSSGCACVYPLFPFEDFLHSGVSSVLSVPCRHPALPPGTHSVSRGGCSAIRGLKSLPPNTVIWVKTHTDDFSG